MKILKYILYIILGLVVIYFLIGLMKPSVSYGYTIEVDKSVEEAWAVSQDESKFSQWLEGFKSMELLSGEDGAVGSTYKIIVNPGEGQEDFEMIETVVSKEEFDHIEMDFDSEFMDFKQRIDFSENDGKTTISTDSKVIGKNVMSRSMFAIMEMLGGAFTKQEGKNMEALKTLINENTTDYYPEPEVNEPDSLSTSMEAVEG